MTQLHTRDRIGPQIAVQQNELYWAALLTHVEDTLGERAPWVCGSGGEHDLEPIVVGDRVVGVKCTQCPFRE